MTQLEVEVVAAWKQAAADLGFEFTSPFVVTLADGSHHEHLGLVRLFGRRLGAVISVLNEPSENIPRPPDTDYFCSTLGPGYARYERQHFIDTLDDWQFLGPETDRPWWYTGNSGT